MKNLDTIREEYLTNFKEAFKSGDAEKAAAAFTQYNDALIESIKAAAASPKPHISIEAIASSFFPNKPQHTAIIPAIVPYN